MSYPFILSRTGPDANLYKFSDLFIQIGQLSNFTGTGPGHGNVWHGFADLMPGWRYLST